MSPTNRMKDLRIIIVSWNVEKHLDACLASLPDACKGLAWDCVVVDNASTDQSIKVASQHGAQIVANPDNRGFAKACNQGLTGSDARYVLLLNPDTVCRPGSLTVLVKAGDDHPRAGILGPRLLNPDGSNQASIRRFPTFWNQAGIMLKLHNFLPSLFRRYFASDVSLDEEQNVDQVMGACFLIRRELMNQVGALDERYFIWFEEVDYCRQAKAAGWEVRYIPQSVVKHVGGQSFGQVFSLRKQSYFNHSLVRYFKKWHPAWQAMILQGLQPVSLWMAWGADKLGLGGKGGRAVLTREKEIGHGRTVAGWAAVIVTLEVISALTIFRDSANAVACLTVGLIVGVLAYKRPTLALAAIALELIIGSKGQLLQVWGWPGLFSLRMVMFTAFMLGWFVNWLHAGGKIWRLFRERMEWVLLGGVLVYAFIRGTALGNGPVFADANAWVFIIMLVPVLDLITRFKQLFKKDVIPVLIVGPIWLAVKTLGLEYLFSHGFKTISPPAYLWVRRTGVGEVTLVVANAFRIFMQSYIFALPVLFFCASYHFTTHDKGMKETKKIIDGLLLSAIVVLAISLSRSMWIGSAAGLISLAWFYRAHVKQFWQGSLRMAVTGIVALVLVFITLAFPVPKVDVASLGALFGSRISTGDAAAVSRWRLFTVVKDKIMEYPILGSGFGATVTYKTQDPRILAQNPSGLYTTYAFEWGWLEHWVKFGLLGFVWMIVLVVRIGMRILQSEADTWIKYGAVASLIGLVATHVFTPYLNHPLGLGYLFFLEGLSLLYSTDKKPALL